jgi:hypothetical protein
LELNELPFSDDAIVKDQMVGSHATHPTKIKPFIKMVSNAQAL